MYLDLTKEPTSKIGAIFWLIRELTKLGIKKLKDNGSFFIDYAPLLITLTFVIGMFGYLVFTGDFTTVNESTRNSKIMIIPNINGGLSPMIIP